MINDNLIGSDIEKIAKSRRTFESGHVIVSQSARVYWKKTEDDPCVFFTIDTVDGLVRLTLKETLNLFEFIKRNPTYLGIPLHLDSACTKEVAKTDYNLIDTLLTNI